MSPFRIFVSYYHEDEEIAQRLVAVLRGLKHELFWSAELPGGSWFQEEIRRQIDRAHFFVPLLTRKASVRPWVQQEIGYALARYVPVVPVVVGQTPRQLAMLSQLNALVLKDSSELERKLQGYDWPAVLAKREVASAPVFQCDSDATIRSRLLAESARYVSQYYRSARIRQQSALTSFSLPSVLGDQDWRTIPQPVFDNLFWLNTEERASFELLARSGGCDLVIDPDFLHLRFDTRVQRARLRTLRRFLESMDDEKVRVVVERFETPESVTIIGDHWTAHSAAVAPFQTRRQTISTWHAPTVGHFCDIFESNFSELLHAQAGERGSRSSRQYAIDRIAGALEGLDRRKRHA